MSEQTSIKFSDLNLIKPLLQAIEDSGYEVPSPIQAESIPPLLDGRDLLGQAQTGTGKTAAFALPLLSNLDLSKKYPQVLVLTPTRELAIQVAEAWQTYARHLKGFHVLPIYGGQNIGIQLRQMRRDVHVVVGTPGRIMDHLRRGTLKLADLKTVVLDEADEMLRMGFIDDVETILKDTPDERQVVLFSATMPAPIKRITSRYLRDPVEIKIKNKTSTVSTIKQLYWKGKTFHKLDVLTRILEADEFGAVIVFVRTKSMTVELSEKLEARGYATTALNGDIKQDLREKTINRLKKGSLDIIVATDVVARGLDVKRITHVINYDMPHDTESYVHRIGRTGRAGREGTAILFIPPRGDRMLQSIERSTGQKIEPLKLPSSQDITNNRIARFKENIINAANNNKLDFFETLVTELSEESDLNPTQIAAALSYLVQRDRPLIEKKGAIPDFAFSAKNEGRNEGRRDRQRNDRKRGERNDRRNQDSRKRKPRKNSDNKDDVPMTSYRLEVGSEHGAEAKHIVGALINEAGLESQYIQNLKIDAMHSTVSLPDGMPKDIYKILYKTWVSGQQLKLRDLSKNEERKFNNRKPRK
ncbi:MAG TPA: DEAD/DEAH box helicase [Leucothrix mucor]|uniref:ATP-dependent RNA helicase DeaD n=1 Tax=Leucothrix mucor TaxID=45248 RepID=A0A7V2T1W4_LEUMU|nr:DEAD/DEAH box helicase [Leucothrix mucor]